VARRSARSARQRGAFDLSAPVGSSMAPRNVRYLRCRVLGWRGRERIGETMLKRSIVAAALMLMLTPAVAGPDGDIVRKFGLFGTWAVDCSKPPSDDNTYEEYTPSETGYPTRTWYRKKADRYASAQSFEMRNVRIVGSDRLAYLDVRKADGDLTNIVLAMVGNRHRSMNRSIPTTARSISKTENLSVAESPRSFFRSALAPERDPGSRL